MNILSRHFDRKPTRQSTRQSTQQHKLSQLQLMSQVWSWVVVCNRGKKASLSLSKCRTERLPRKTFDLHFVCKKKWIRIATHNQLRSLSPIKSRSTKPRNSAAIRSFSNWLNRFCQRKQTLDRVRLAMTRRSGEREGERESTGTNEKWSDDNRVVRRTITNF